MVDPKKYKMRATMRLTKNGLIVIGDNIEELGKIKAIPALQDTVPVKRKREISR